MSTGTKPPPLVGFYSGYKKATKSHDSSEASHDLTNQSDPQYQSPDNIACLPVEENMERLKISDENGQGLSDVESKSDYEKNIVDDLELNKDVGDLEQYEDSEDSLGDESSDEDSWITPSNYQAAREKMGGALETNLSGIAVGCVTTDYAMQVQPPHTLTLICPLHNYTCPLLHTVQVNKKIY